MEGSQIQQGTSSSTQTGTFTLTNGADVEKFLDLLKQQLAQLSLNNDDTSVINSDMVTIESQINSSRPKPGVIRESLLSIQRILEGAAGGVIAQQLLPYVPPLLAALS